LRSEMATESGGVLTMRRAGAPGNAKTNFVVDTL